MSNVKKASANTKKSQINIKKRNRVMINKTNVTYFLIGICDIFLVLFCAFKNKVQYTVIFDESFLVGKTRDMIFGKNYINLIITFFFYVYLLLMNRFFLKRRNTKKFLVGSFFAFIIANFVLFYLCTKRVY